VVQERFASGHDFAFFSFLGGEYPT